MFKQAKSLIKLEKKSIKKLSSYLLSLFLDIKEPNQIVPTSTKIGKNIYKEIKEVRQEAFKIADKYSQVSHTISDKNRYLITSIASNNLTNEVARRIAVKVMEDQTYSISIIKEAVEESKPSVKKIISTEVFQAYNTKLIANNKNLKGKFIWNAELDKTTCAKCEALDGTVYENSDDIPYYSEEKVSVHPRCRCIILFVLD